MSGYRALAIEASTDRLSIAASHGGCVAEWQGWPARSETERVFEHATRLLAEVGGSIAELDFVAFGRGPGSFTGIRIAAAAAQSIAYARGLPVCRVSSLAVLAASAGRALGAGLVATCLDARMQRVYVGLYRVLAGEGVVCEIADSQAVPGDFEFPGHEPLIAVGSGWKASAELAARHRSRIVNWAPDIAPAAVDLLELAARDFAAGRVVAPEDALPDYLGHGPVDVTTVAAAE